MKICSCIAAAIAALFIMNPSVTLNALSSTSKGYGQGTQTDSNNCPICASDFDSLYGKYASNENSDD